MSKRLAPYEEITLAMNSAIAASVQGDIGSAIDILERLELE